MNKAQQQQAATMKPPKAPKKITLPIQVHPFAISQARAFANLARSIAVGMEDRNDSGEMLAFVVNASFSIELYLKGLMIAGHQGIVTTGHDLEVLYEDFPPYLRAHLEFTYASMRPHDGWKYTLQAMVFSEIHPRAPQGYPASNFQTFADALTTTKKAFEEGRYFFEKLNDTEWHGFVYAPEPLHAAMAALEHTYQHFVAGSFAEGRDMIAEKRQGSDKP